MEFNRSIDISMVPKAHIDRSVFDLSSSLYTTFNCGMLIPTYIKDVLPGDTFKVETSSLARLQTLLTPMMGEVYLDQYWFYVPNRLCWTHWKEFMGENTTSAWKPTVQYTEPSNVLTGGTDSTQGAYKVVGSYHAKTIGDYMGIPTEVGVDVSALPFRAYCLVWNEFFRDQNTQDPVLVNLGDNGFTGRTTVTPSSFDPSLQSIKLNYAQYGVTMPLPANKYHDLFTSALPEPQKGPDTTIPFSGFAPVIAKKTDWTAADLIGSNLVNPNSERNKIYPVTFGTFTGSNATTIGSITSGQDLVVNNSGELSRTSNSSVTTNTNHPVFTNLAVDYSQGVQATINDLRLAFATQRYYEQLARSGSRYTELLSSLFGVDSPDARLQRPEYLGGSHQVLNVEQVVQLSESSANSPLGDTGAYSLSFDKSFSFEKSFVEHGWIICVATARIKHDYQQGLQKMWSRRDKFDYFWPQFANIGEVPVLSKELYADGTSADDNVFGYQEAWYDYRYSNSATVTGEMRSNYVTSLDVWHLADDYSSRPTLSGDWMMEDKSNVDRVLTVQSSVSDQILLNEWFDVKATRPLPVYSIPGGLDFR